MTKLLRFKDDELWIMEKIKESAKRNNRSMMGEIKHLLKIALAAQEEGQKKS